MGGLIPPFPMYNELLVRIIGGSNSAQLEKPCFRYLEHLIWYHKFCLERMSSKNNTDHMPTAVQLIIPDNS